MDSKRFLLRCFLSRNVFSFKSVKEPMYKKKFVYHSFLIVLLTVFVSLPCSTKRELKQYLGIATSTSLPSTKPAIGCVSANTSFRNSASYSIQVSAKQKIFPYAESFFSWTTSQKVPATLCPDVSFSKTPVYLLHRQLLI
jgi:hypothetical protein